MKLLPVVLLFAGAVAAAQAQTTLAPSLSGEPTQVSADPGTTGPVPTAPPVAKSDPGRNNLSELLGLTLAQVFADYGPPEDVFALRGQSDWQDDVVFYYPDHSYLFWYQDRVWQVRVDKRYVQTVLGVTIGESMADVEHVLGQPFHADDSSLVFLLPDQGYPVRARLFFDAGALTDVYVYRGDF